MMRTITVSHEQYRMYAEWCKAEAGQVLEVSAEAQLRGDFAASLFMAWEVIADVRDKLPSYQHEVSRIELAPSIAVGTFRRAGRGRPEINWDALTDDEIYPFLIWHEIGHRRDNFDLLDVMWNRSQYPAQVVQSIRWVNEVLADRFAWQRIRPGESPSLTSAGRRDQQRIADAISCIGQHCKRAQYKVRPISAGQYSHVSPRMLETVELAAFVGPDVHPELLAHHIWKGAARRRRQANPKADAFHVEKVAA